MNEIEMISLELDDNTKTQMILHAEVNKWIESVLLVVLGIPKQYLTETKTDST